MEDVQTKILQLKLDYQATVNGIYEYEKAIANAKQEQKALGEELKRGKISQEEYDKRMIESRAEVGRYQKEVRTFQNALDQQIKMQRADGDSLEQLRARLSVLTRQYDNMSQSMREGEAGKALKDQINEITSALKQGEEETQRYYRNVGNYTKSIEEAFNGLDKSLDKLKKQYAEVAKAEGADSAAAKELRDQIQAQEAAINATRAASSKLYSNIIPFSDKLLPILQGGIKGITAWLTSARQGVALLGKQFAALITNPIVAALAAIAAVIGLVVAGLKGSEDNSNKLSKVLAPLTRLFALLQNILQSVCGWILSAVEFGGKLAVVLGNIVEFLTSQIPLVGEFTHSVMEATREAIDLAEREAQLAKDKRALVVAEAKTEMEVAELRNKAQDKLNTSIEERLAANKKAIEQEKAIADERLRLAQEEFTIASQRAEWSDNSAEDNDKLAQAEAALYKARADYAKKTKELLASQITLENELVNERKNTVALRRQAQDQEVAMIANGAEKQRVTLKNQYNRQIEDLQLRLETERTLTEEQRKAINDTILGLRRNLARELEQIAKDEQAKLLTLRRQAEDQEVALIQNSAEQKRTSLLLSYNRQIEDLKRTLETDKGLTESERKAINDTILGLQKNLDRELEQADNEEKARQRDILRAEEDARLAIMQDANDKARAQTLANYDRQIEDLKWRLETEKGLTQTEIDAINSMIISKGIERAQALAKVDEEAAKQELLRVKNDYTERMQAAADNSVVMAQLELEQKQQALDALHQMEGESEQAFRERQLQAQQEYTNAKKQLVETEMQVEQAKYELAVSISGGMSKALEALGESNKTFAKMSKALALGEIAINSGKAIAAGTAQAQSVPYPANLVAIATTVATVLANVATAIKTVKSAKFATGGVNIQGAGTGTSDSILAMISNGESVMNAAATAMFANELQAMNSIGAAVTPQLGGVTMNNAEPSILTEGMKAAIEDLHPVVSVVDINQGQQRVDVVENIATL